jgi:hypothetical protein
MPITTTAITDPTHPDSVFETCYGN